MKPLGVLCAALVCVTGAAAAPPAARHTVGGTSAAKASLLTLGDLGKGWKATPPAGSGVTLACSGYHPSGKGVVETGAAGTESFAAGEIGPFVSQTTSVYASARQASTLWSRGVRPRLIACVAQSLETLATRGVAVKIVSEGRLALANVADRTSAYRVVATISSAKRSDRRTVYFDVILVGRADAISELTLTSLARPVPANVERALATIVAHRIGRPTA